ncbi:MAG: hypothetical protein E6X17_03830 [Sporomusaceae bacterium]|nr:hypothetical protein [Sporomusaceae bacterium]
MDRVFTLYADQLQRILARVEENKRKNPLASEAITLIVSDNDRCLKLLQKAGHDWIFLDEEQFCEWK